MTGFPRIFSSACATGRAARSAWPPGGNGTIMVMLREGYAPCAKAGFENAVCASGSAAAAFNSSRRFMGSLSPEILFWLLSCKLAWNRRVGKAQRAHHSFTERPLNLLHISTPICDQLTTLDISME